MKTRLHVALTLAFASALHLNLAYPQSVGKANATAAQTLMTAATRGTAPLSEESVGRIEALGLPPTAANVASVQRLLAQRQSEETRTSLIYLLASLYVPQGDAAQNESIARTTKSYVYGADRKVASAALLSYSRLGTRPDLWETLDYGLEHNLLSATDYCRELAIALPRASSAMQVSAANRLVARNQPEGVEFLAFNLNTPGAINKLVPEARAIVRAYLEKNEPQPPKAIGEYGITDGLRYGYWLATLSQLSAADGKEQAGDFIFKRLTADNTDPRNVLGFLSSPSGLQYINTVGSRPELTQLVERALVPAHQFPGHPVYGGMAEMVNRQVSRRLASLK